jgi:hypothetical protein
MSHDTSVPSTVESRLDELLLRRAKETRTGCLLELAERLSTFFGIPF